VTGRQTLSAPGEYVELIEGSYHSQPKWKTSDHKPVCAKHTVQVFKPDVFCFVHVCTAVFV